ncbi:MAG: hypothetical protein ABL973_16310 [Micropepsaceae bacterium]
MSFNRENAQDIAVAEALSTIAGPIFGAAWCDGSLIVHVSEVTSARALRRSIQGTLAASGVKQVRIRFHNADKLARAKSLEALVARVDGDQFVYDPTGTLARAQAMVSVSRRVREQLGARARGFYYAPLLRSYYVVLNKSETGKPISLSDLTQIEDTVVESVKASFHGFDGAVPAVRVGFVVPKTNLVPVDIASVESWRSRLGTVAQRYWKPATIVALFGFGLSTPAHAEGPAVSEPNLKLRGSAGQVIDDFSWNVEGDFTAPLSEKIGVALEAGMGQRDQNDYWGAGGHIFARDPETYLIGLFAAYSQGNEFNVDLTRVGGEFEFYFQDITVSGSGGYQFSADLGDKAFGSLDFKWYADENFAISAGAFGDKDDAFARGRLEWQPGFAALPGLAFNAEGVLGEDDYHSVMGGLTYYFGTPANLKDRHRKQDPESALFGLFQAIQLEQQRLCEQYGNCGSAN